MLEDSHRWFSYLLVLSSVVNTCAFSTGHCRHQASTTTATCSSFFGVTPTISSLWRVRKNVYNSNVSLRKQMAENSENESRNSNEELEDLYRTVAENDSDWYKEFVLDVLGEEAAVDLPPPSPTEIKNTKEPESLSSPVALDEESDKNGEEVVTEKEETNEGMMEKNKSKKPSIEDNVVSEEVKVGSDKDSNEKIATIVDNEAVSEAAVVSSQQNDNIDKNNDATNPADVPPKRTRVKSVVEAEVDEIVGSIKQMLGANTEQQVQTSNLKSDTEVDDELTKNVVEDKDTGTNDNDDLDVSDTKENDMSKRSTVEQKQPSMQVANVGSSEPTQSEKEQVSSAQTTSSDDIPIVTNQDDDSNDDGANNVVQFRNLFTGRFQSVPLKILLELGYEQSEIPYLQPDALELIVEEQISKPRMGIPPQWKISESQYKVLPNDVRIIPQAEAALIEEKQKLKTRRSDPASNRRTRQDEDSDESPEMDEQGKGKTGDLETESRQPRKRPTAGSSESIENKRRRIPTNDDDNDDQNEFSDRPRKSRTKGRPSRQGTNASDGVNERRIYTGRDGQPKRRTKTSRPAVARRRQDPPGNRFWPGMDTFRGLLATESEMRLRILGREWTDVVRDEADWRLDTYKTWLEMLDEGVGTPLMESRSDRDRKVRNKYVVTESPPSRSKRKPTRRREQEIMDMEREDRRRPRRRSKNTEQRRRTRPRSVLEDGPTTNAGDERRKRRRVNDSSSEQRKDSRPRRRFNDPTMEMDSTDQEPRRRRPRNDDGSLPRKDTNVSSRRRPQLETEWEDDIM